MTRDKRNTLPYRKSASGDRTRPADQRLALFVARAVAQGLFVLLSLVLLISGLVWVIVTGGDSAWWVLGGSVLLLLMFAGAGWCFERVTKRMK